MEKTNIDILVQQFDELARQYAEAALLRYGGSKSKSIAILREMINERPLQHNPTILERAINFIEYRVANLKP